MDGNHDPNLILAVSVAELNDTSTIVRADQETLKNYYWTLSKHAADSPYYGNTLSLAAPQFSME